MKLDGDSRVNNSRRSGIFAITNLVTGRMYIGQSSDLRKVKYNYFRLLKEGKLVSEDFQYDFNCFGEEMFEFEVIEYCGVKCLAEKKRYYVNFYREINRDNLYYWGTWSERSERFKKLKEGQRVKGVCEQGVSK